MSRSSTDAIDLISPPFRHDHRHSRLSLDNEMPAYYQIMVTPVIRPWLMQIRDLLILTEHRRACGPPNCRKASGKENFALAVRCAKFRMNRPMSATRGIIALPVTRHEQDES